VNTAAITAIATVGAALITALSVYAVGKIGRKTSSESQGVQALAESVDGFRELLIETRKEHERKLADLQEQLDQGAEKQSTLTARVQHLELALAAARRYIDSLLGVLRRADIDPPDPPSDYTH
jgi:chromosome segregation ATPase